MAAKLVERKVENVIPVTEMQNGQVGVIVKWEHHSYTGLIVHRVGKKLNVLGDGTGDGWNNISFGNIGTPFDNCLVRVFQPGEIVEIQF